MSDADRPATMADVEALAVKVNAEVNRALEALTSWVVEFMKGSAAFDKQAADAINGMVDALGGGALPREPAQVLRLEHAVVAGPARKTIERDRDGNMVAIVDQPA